MKFTATAFPTICVLVPLQCSSPSLFVNKNVEILENPRLHVETVMLSEAEGRKVSRSLGR